MRNSSAVQMVSELVERLVRCLEAPDRFIQRTFSSKNCSSSCSPKKVSSRNLFIQEHIHPKSYSSKMLSWVGRGQTQKK